MVLNIKHPSHLRHLLLSNLSLILTPIAPISTIILVLSINVHDIENLASPVLRFFRSLFRKSNDDDDIKRKEVTRKSNTHTSEVVKGKFGKILTTNK